MTDLRYPIGKFSPHKAMTADERLNCVSQIAETPTRIRAAVSGLDDTRLDTPYRDGGWTVRQVVHHIADSHINAYVRFKLAFTEEQPLVKTYEEKLWAETHEARTAPVGISLMLLEGLHMRWVEFLRSLQPGDFARQFKHPDHGLMDMNFLVSLYSWHGRHHEAHITGLRSRKGW